MHLSNRSAAQTAKHDCVGNIRNRHLKILIVDDELKFRRSMSFNLRRKYEADVKDVGSGAEAMETLKAGETFDLIFVDLMMPNMSGTETYSELKLIDARCPIVLMSAHSDRKEWEKAALLDVELLSKPIPAQVMNRVLLRVPRR